MNWQRIGILAQFDLGHAILRLKGLVFLIPVLFFWYWILKLLLDNGSQWLVSKESFMITAYLFNPGIAQILLISHPPSLSVFFIVALATMPFFVMLAANDQLASDAGRQTFRYLLIRCTRAEIFLGRFISSYFLIAIVVIFTGILATLISLHNDNHAVQETLEYALQVIALVLLYTLPFVAYMAVISAFMSSALSALLTGVIVYVVLIILGAYLNHYLPVKISLVPSGVKDYLYAIKPDDLSYALTGLLAYICIYTCLGWLIFRRRNI